jgi:hypothetical protein
LSIFTGGNFSLEGELIPNAEEQAVAAQERADKLAQRLQ